MDLLHAEGLEKGVGHRLILDDVTLSVPAGSCLALLGPNGAGKSTLIKVLAGLARATAGRYYIEEKDPLEEPEARRRLGVALHESMLYGDLTAKENLLFYARLYGVKAAHARAEELLRAFGLELYAEELVRSFSRGMTQRLSLARAFLHQPKLLLLDEVFAGLDLSGVSLAVKAVQTACAAGAAAIIVTHELPVAKQLADRVLFLVGGRVAFKAQSCPQVWDAVAARLGEGGGVV